MNSSRRIGVVIARHTHRRTRSRHLYDLHTQTLTPFPSPAAAKSHFTVKAPSIAFCPVLFNLPLRAALRSTSSSKFDSIHTPRKCFNFIFFRFVIGLKSGESAL